MVNLISGAQMRGARGILKWSVGELERQSGVSSMTIKRMESGDAVPSARIENIEAIYKAFIDTGRVRFEGETGVFVEPGEQ